MKIFILPSLILSFTSGHRLENKITNGGKSSPKHWMVALRYIKGGGCGGVLYTKSLVISVAHCAKHDFKDWHAHLNRFDLSKEGEKGSSVHNVLRYARHPQYSSTLRFDVSAWWIQSNSDERTIVDLDDGSEFKDKSDLLSIAGWGRMKMRAPNDPVGEDPSSAILLEARVPLNDDNKCIARYPQDYGPETMLCTGYDVSGASTCKGDSGGPVYRARGDRIILIGIISHGKGCGYQDYYSKETKVSNPGVIKFIKNYTELFTLDNLDNVVLDLSERYRELPNSSNATSTPSTPDSLGVSENIAKKPTSPSITIKPEDQTRDRFVPVRPNDRQHYPGDSVSRQTRPNHLQDADLSSNSATTSDQYDPQSQKGRQPERISPSVGTVDGHRHQVSSSQTPAPITYTDEKPQQPLSDNGYKSIKYRHQNSRDQVPQTPTAVDGSEYGSSFPNFDNRDRFIVHHIVPANYELNHERSHLLNQFGSGPLFPGLSSIPGFSTPMGLQYHPPAYVYYPRYHHLPGHPLSGPFLR